MRFKKGYVQDKHTEVAMIIAQISDLHVKRAGERAYGVVDTNGLVERAVAYLNQQRSRPDCGDCYR